jgi:hypothetical protein
VREQFARDEQHPAEPARRTGAGEAAGSPGNGATLARLRAALRLDYSKEVSNKTKARKMRAQSLCSARFDFVERELDQLDRLATQGYRSGRPSLLLVIDQLEEVFRPEVAGTGRQGPARLDYCDCRPLRK